MVASLFREIHDLPAMELGALPEASLAVSLLIPARNSAHSIEKTVSETHAFLSARFGSDFEIIIIPNPPPAPAPGDPVDRTPEAAAELCRRFKGVRSVLHTGPAGKGAALRTGFQASRGRWIFFTDADLPYGLEFFESAAAQLESGADFVTGNRRLPESHFHLPVELLKIAYRRHKLGLAFNRVVRWLLPIRTTDTQAGIKAMSRELAIQAFSRQLCPGFFFDLEFFLCAAGGGFAHVAIPVTLHLNTEKSTVRVLRESLLAAYWLSRITLQHWRGSYGRPPSPRARLRTILPRYQGASFGTRLFLLARWALTPYSVMAAKLPRRGKILDRGCGHGLLSLAIALEAPGREVLGVDHDSARIALAEKAATGVPNLRFRAGGMAIDAGLGPYAGMVMIDVMHYFDPEAQEALLREAFERLEDGGILLVREVEPQAGIASSWNRLYEKIATASGFTRSEKTELYFRTTREWEALLRRVGFEVFSEPCSSILFSDVLFVCERPRGRPSP